MSVTAPPRAHQSYRHEAFLWHGRADFLAGLVPFVEEGLDAGEAVMAVLTPEHTRWLSDALGERADDVRFVDMLDLGRNPARIIPAWLDFLETSCGPGRPARGVGEPMWPGRRTDEVGEAQLHEALLNLAADPELPFWLVCPYDLEHLDPALVADVGLSHPVIATATSYEGSSRYRGRDHARRLFTADLPTIERPDADLWVTRRSVGTVTERVTLEATAGDLRSDTVVTLTDVVRSLVVDSVDRGAARVHVRMWDQPEAVVCEVDDRLVIDDFLVGRRRPDPDRRDPLWLANQALDLVQVRSGPQGTRVRLHARK